MNTHGSLFHISQRPLATSLALLCVCLLPAATFAVSTNVTFQNFSFTPQTVTIQSGDTVTWTNAGGTHTVTGDGANPFCGSGVVPVSCSVTFTNSGTFP